MIKNYTTKIDVSSSVGEIQAALARVGASKIMIEYAGGKALAISFCVDTASGLRGFALPAPIEGTLRVFKKQGIKCTPEQSARVAWRNVRDWVLAQAALVESCDAAIDEVFLPYMTDGTGKSLYQIYSSGQLCAPEGRAK
nr:MAG TPA_asm: hypothetical protein [Caudoviricetes sp.]